MKNDAPNILWICSDQQRWNTLGCTGNPWVNTPHLNQLAAGGCLFENAFCQNPLCTPSRASFLTGRFPRTTRCYQNGQSLPASEVPVTAILADAGYTCGLAGKLHLAACDPSVCPEEEPRIHDGYSEFNWSHHSFPGMRKSNQYRQWLEDKGETFRWTDHPETEFVKVGMPDELHQTTWCAEKAIAFMNAHAEDDAPWLFSVNMFDPHSAFDPPQSRLDPYLEKLDDIPLPHFIPGELENKPIWQSIDHQGSHGGKSPLAYTRLNEREHRLIRAAYWAMCDLIDDQVGHMLRALEESGQLENTLVIYMSDHGEMLGDHGIYLKGPYLYEELIHVPLIFSFPGKIIPQRSTALVELMDLPQTLLDAAGIPAPASMQGQTLWPLLTGAADSGLHKPDVYCEFYDAMSCHQNPSPRLSMIRDTHYKLVVDHCHSQGELYNLKTDIHEHQNLWEDPAYNLIKSDLLLRLSNRMASTVDPTPFRTAPW